MNANPKFTDELEKLIPVLKSNALKLSRDLADDLFQETYLRSLERQSQFNPNITPRGIEYSQALRIWTWTIMNNIFKDMKRSEKRKRTEDISDYDRPESEKNIYDAVDLNRLSDVLKEKEQRAARLFAEGFSYPDIAKELQVAVCNVSILIKRARIKMKVYAGR